MAKETEAQRVTVDRVMHEFEHGEREGFAEQIAFITEMANASAPVQAHSTGESIVAQALFLHGTKAQQNEWLQAIRRGGIAPFLG